MFDFFQLLFSNCCVLLFDFQIRNSMPCFQNLAFRIDISHFAAAPSSPAFVLYRVAAFRIALGSLRFSLFYVVSFRVVPRLFKVRCAIALLFLMFRFKNNVLKRIWGFDLSNCVFKVHLVNCCIRSFLIFNFKFVIQPFRFSFLFVHFWLSILRPKQFH